MEDEGNYESMLSRDQASRWTEVMKTIKRFRGRNEGRADPLLRVNWSEGEIIYRARDFRDEERLHCTETWKNRLCPKVIELLYKITIPKI